MSSDQSSQYSLYQMGATENIGDGNTEWNRQVIFIPSCIGEPRHRLQQKVLARFVFPRSFSTITGYFSINDLWIDLPGIFIIKTNFIHYARAEIMGNDICLGNQPFYPDQVFFVFKVGSKTFLIPVNSMKEQAAFISP